MFVRMSESVGACKAVNVYECECVCKLVRCVSACLFGAILNSESGVSVQAVSSEQGDPEPRACRLIQEPWRPEIDLVRMVKN